MFARIQIARRILGRWHTASRPRGLYLATLFVLAGLGGCGQTGPLFFPPPPRAPAASGPAPVPAAAASAALAAPRANDLPPPPPASGPAILAPR